jgi:diguanylate cyclase (GGDEF)-like protein/PAS domain S-box-containing protein
MDRSVVAAHGSVNEAREGGASEDRPRRPAGTEPNSDAHQTPHAAGAATAVGDLEERERQLRIAVAALDERERVLRAGEELVQLGSWMWEAGAERVSWSDYVHQLFGTDPADPPATYDVYVSMVHPDDRERVVSVVRNAAVTGDRYEVEHRIVRRDGEVREIRGRGRAELDADGRPARLTGGLQDVTEMRVAARELRASRDLFAGVLDAATEQSIIATDPNGLITVFNTGAERMLGYPAEEMIGTSPERVHDAAEIRARAEELGMEPGFGVFLAGPATGTPETRQWTYVTRDGRRLLASITVSAMWGPGGELTGFIKVGTDITERVQAQAALQETESRLHTIDHAPIGLAVVSLDQRFLEVNPAFCEIAGYRPEQLLHSVVAETINPVQAESDEDAMAALLRGDLPSHTTDVRIHAGDGSLRWVSSSSSLHRGADGSPSQYIVQIKDISERKQAELALLEKARRLRAAETVGRSGSWEVDLATGRMSWSDGLFDIYGVDPGTFGGNYAAAEELLHPADRPRVRAMFDACAEFGVPYTVQYRLTRPSDGALRWCKARAERLTAKGQPTRVGGSVVDVTELVLAENKIHAAYTFQQAVMDASPDVILAYRLTDRSVVWSNRSLAASLGFTDQVGFPEQTSDLDGLWTGTRPSTAGVPAFGAALLAALDTVADEPAQLDLALDDAAGDQRWFSLRTTPLHRDDRGSVTELLVILRDMTDAMAAQQHLEHTALHDSLTGLPNRALLIDRIDGALARSERDHREISVLYCDLDGFKHVNDTAGHAAGDAVLVETARRLQHVLRDGDTVARVGGDEFIILIEPWNRRPATEHVTVLGPDEVAAQDRALAPRIAARIAKALREPVVVNGVDHVVTASIGVTYGSMSHAGDLRTASADEMLADADAAMYKAKSRGKDRFEVFELGMRASLRERGRAERILRQALSAPTAGDTAAGDTAAGDTAAGDTAAVDGTAGDRAGQQRARMTAAYQPIFDSTHHLVGFEALARLTDTNGVHIAPDVFIGIAEEIGVIHQLGLRILDLACRQLATWLKSPVLDGITMAVNVSAIQAADSSLGDDVRRALRTHGLQPRDLVLELTETALLQAAHSTIVNLRSLHDEGVGIAIDDFGIGYASLRYLATLPVSALKIDRSFTAGLPHDDVSRKIVTAVAGLAADLDMTCIVEGVETEGQRDALPAGVQLQGYLTGRPQPPHAIDLRQLTAQRAIATPGNSDRTPPPTPTKALVSQTSRR